VCFNSFINLTQLNSKYQLSESLKQNYCDF